MASMLGLTDVLPPSEKVSWKTSSGDQHVDVIGISARGIAVLVSKFPVLLRILATGSKNVSFDEIKKAAPDAVAAIIAAACGGLEDPAAEAAADRLPIGVQMKIFKAMGKVTFPDGFGPFVESLQSLQGEVVEAVRSSKASPTRSPRQEKSSEQPPTPESGTSRQDK